MNVSVKGRLFGLLLLGGLALPAVAVTFTGELQALQSESVIVPPSSSSPVVLRYVAPEGELVEPGDVLVRIDPGNSASQVLQLEAQLALQEATVARDVAVLQVAAADAERGLLDAEAALSRARIDAGIPREHLSALDHDRYRGELERATREAALKKEELAAAREAIVRKRRDATLEADKLRADLAWHRSQVENAEQRAESRGRVVYGFDSWRGTRYEEGASAHAGTKIGEVVGEGGFEVRGWLLEPDRAGVSMEQEVMLHFDAFPGRPVRGRIERISGAPEPRAQWGDGRYFEIDVRLLDPAPEGALPGMSVRIESGGAA
ncbi:HlyD family secretion protein [Pseudomarimonas salicorniae]|uniref:HlyD family secretion protein n=1 Tax=Pseudomarimonas salicorniae TaxID=2933270 RepID=A0ABT0GCX0_9GAMM|nr:HlyD family efflux transporter periplasmic adaptor subunit [Lysobacter sp. CAU 1642]MCK7592384.1 HlyD family secretion protein [Lysobacter sp. CAU 1642]